MYYAVFLQLNKIAKSASEIEEFTLIREKFAMLTDLTKLIFVMIFACHISACGWHLIGYSEIE